MQNDSMHTSASDLNVFTFVVGVLIAVAGSAAALALDAPDAPRFVVSALLFVAGISVASVAQVRMTITPTHVRITTIAPWPARSIPRRQIRAATPVDDIRPFNWGGWGIRWLPGKRAWIARRGPALVMLLDNDVIVAVTVLDPAEAAAHLGVPAVEMPGN